MLHHLLLLPKHRRAGRSKHNRAHCASMIVIRIKAARRNHTVGFLKNTTQTDAEVVEQGNGAVDENQDGKPEDPGKRTDSLRETGAATSLPCWK